MSSSNNSSSSSEPPPSRRRFFTRRLRRASFILPATGERSKRVFTLRDASHRLSGPGGSETTPLLGGNGSPEGDLHESNVDVLQAYARKRWLGSWKFWTSKTGIGIIKCSLAYLLGSLATFVPAISGLIGHSQDSKHMVATVTVWFHPARTIGSMHEATVLSFIAFCYSGFVSFTSMGVSMFFGSRDLLVVGHAIVLVVFIGGGLGLVAWVKQRMGHPLVNVACSLASLGCITVMIKEGAVQAGEFSDGRVFQVLLMVLMGIITTTVVNLCVLPVTARSGLGKDLQTATDLLGEMLISITRAFLSGRKSDLEDSYYKSLTKEHSSSLSSMAKNLDEAKREYLVIGRERQYDVEARIVECLTGLSQDLGGLRSAAFAEFAFIEQSQLPLGTGGSTPVASRDLSPVRDQSKYSSMLNSISESPENEYPPWVNGNNDSKIQGDSMVSSPTSTQYAPGRIGSTDASLHKSPRDVFQEFLIQLGPPSKSLVYTLKQILDDLPFRECTPESGWMAWLSPSREVAINEHFVSSLKQAINLYSESRIQALDILYQNRAQYAATLSQNGGRLSTSISQRSLTGVERQAQTEEVLADIEEVTACCGHFSFSLLDFAQDVLTYLELLEELKQEMAAQRYSWRWLIFWKRQHRDPAPRSKPYRTFSNNDTEHNLTPGITTPIKRADDFAAKGTTPRSRPWTYPLYKVGRFLRRDDVLFAIKVSIGAVLYSMPAFTASTRPFFVLWRGEWGLVSYIVVCCMTIGASNTTGIQRIFGTFLGACLAVCAWVISSDHGEANPWLLGFLGWLVSLGCFYIILAKGNGPMGRFILLTYNLGALYSYSLSIKDDDNDDDEGGIDPAIWDIVVHRFVAVVVGCLWGIFITRFIWPISARKKLQNGICILWLRMSLIWKRDPLAMFLLGEPRSNYMDIREESSLRSFLANLDGLRKAAASEFEFKGPFPDAEISLMLERTARMLDAFHALNVVISKNLQCTPGEAAVLRYTRPERFELSARISHLYSVLASSVKLEYPLNNDALPSIEHTRDRLLGKISEFRRTGEGREEASEQDYELLYAYVLVTGQLSQDIQAVSTEIENLYGTLNEENLKLY